MKINKKKFTKKILDLAFKFPFFFPKHIQHHARLYHSNSKMIKDFKEKNSSNKKISFLDSNPYWKSISFSFILNDDELKLLDKWNMKRSIYLNSNKIINDISRRQFDNNNFSVNIGNVNINKESFIDDMNSMYVDFEYFSSVYISLSGFSSGLSMVTFYIYLNPNVTDLIDSVDLPEMTEFVEFESMNIYNKKMRGLKILDSRSHAIEYLNENMRKVCADAWKLITYFLNEMNINKTKKESHSIIDLYVDREPPYFNGVKNNVDNNQYIIIDRFDEFVNINISESNEDAFISNNYFHIKEVDMVYIKTHPQSKYERYNNFKFMYCSNYDSHLYISIIYLINKKINSLSNLLLKINPFHNKKSLSKLHGDLFDIICEFKVIDSWIKTLMKNGTHRISTGYQKFLNNSLNHMRDRVDSLHETTNSIYSLSENRVQISNIKYNQLYSVVVLILVITQIILAAMTIKWSDKDAWYASLLNWITDII
ncbi:hypothetical protein ABN357_13240 [Providencia rettgeri]|uniref:hypothetical protein n=3 Tax=Morganellaceae TaxID=1903414 RepID=UPI001B391B7A|nr:hypothetical protein [Providencia rettgeri]EJD6046870.1 hypothetical protein [Providencia rettgeri]ELR5090143.1 hypothetical protein [Providencia rettgeri]MBQ0604981.1 hypothetical protein [Providencia rettgeri]MCB4814343.1 hypothetical protein [Providencia rettgeri]MCJ2286576.1 hypothetical protein [Providencia rettgeri]